MRKTREILRLRWGKRLSLRQTAASCRVSSSTVHDTTSRAKAAGLSWPLPAEVDDSQLEALLYPPAPPTGRPLPDFERVYRELKRPGVTLELLYQEYRQGCPENGYGYSHFCGLYRQWRGKLDVVMRHEHRAGEKLFVDYAGQTMPVIDRDTGEITDHPVFVSALGASSFTYAEATEGQDTRSWVEGHIHTYEYIGGVALVTVPDNLKAAVIRADPYEPELNPAYRDMAEHYGTTIIPARVKKPRDKAKVENAVQQVERWVLAPLRNQNFFSRTELNHAIWERLEWLNDRPFSRLEGSRRSLWKEIDRPSLLPLPERRFEIADWKCGVGVNIDYHFEFDRHLYSVPHTLVGKRIDVRSTSTMVEAFHKGQRVASHRKGLKPGGFTTDPAHRPKAHQRYAEWSPSRLIRWGETIGPETGAVIAHILEAKPHPEQGFRSCLGILRLAKRYSNTRLESAAKRARSIRSVTYRSISSILKNDLDRKPLPDSRESQQSFPLLEHKNLRGPDYYH